MKCPGEKNSLLHGVCSFIQECGDKQFMSIASGHMQCSVAQAISSIDKAPCKIQCLQSGIHVSKPCNDHSTVPQSTNHNLSCSICMYIIYKPSAAECYQW